MSKLLTLAQQITTPQTVSQYYYMLWTEVAVITVSLIKEKENTNREKAKFKKKLTLWGYIFQTDKRNDRYTLTAKDQAHYL